MPHQFELSSKLKSAPDKVWQWVERPALFLHVAAPLVRFTPIGADAFPDRWSEAEYRGSMKLFGIIPLGWQAIAISFPETARNQRALEDNGYSPLLPVWKHRIEVTPEGVGTRYIDRVSFDCRPITSFVAPFIRLFFAHRQRRLRALDAKGFEPLGS